MRIGTWNVEYASPGRREAQQEVLRAHRADIWVLTETHDDLAPDGCLNSVHSAPRPRGQNTRVKERSRWVSIWSAFPTRAVAVDLADNERTVVARVDFGPRGQMLVYGTVLPWHTDSGKSGQETNWSEHYRVIEEQRIEWLELRKRYPDASLCIAGDYNTQMVGTRKLPGYRYGTKRGDDALEHALAECGLYCATTPEPPRSLEKRPIDHIALPLGWREKSTVTSIWPAAKGRLSDHSGLVVTVQDWLFRPRRNATNSRAHVG